MLRWMPGLQAASSYRRQWLARDIIAGVVLTTLLVPQGVNAQGISLVFAELKDPVRDKIKRYGLTRTIDPRYFFPTIESAVAAFRQHTGAEWAADGQPTDGQPTADTGPPPTSPHP